MKFEYTSYLLPLLFAAIVSASIAIYAWTRHSVPGALALCLMSFAVFEWAVGYSLEIAAGEANRSRTQGLRYRPAQVGD